jgi:hypothetical protein
MVSCLRSSVVEKIESTPTLMTVVKEPSPAMRYNDSDKDVCAFSLG